MSNIIVDNNMSKLLTLQSVCGYMYIKLSVTHFNIWYSVTVRGGEDVFYLYLIKKKCLVIFTMI